MVRAEVEHERESARPEQGEIYVERKVRSSEYVFAVLITCLFWLLDAVLTFVRLRARAQLTSALSAASI